MFVYMQLFVPSLFYYYSQNTYSSQSWNVSKY